MIRLVWGLLLAALFPSLVLATPYHASVVAVVDGDTLVVLNADHEEVLIRLEHVDTPERAQPFGDKATRYVFDLVHGQTVTIHDTGKRSYGRTIGRVELADGRFVGEELLKMGLAWWYFTYSDDGNLGQLELYAKMARAGLWAQNAPMPPWTFRRLNRGL